MEPVELTNKTDFKGDILGVKVTYYYDPTTKEWRFDYAEKTPEITKAIEGIRFFRLSSPNLEDLLKAMKEHEGKMGMSPTENVANTPKNANKNKTKGVVAVVSTAAPVNGSATAPLGNGSTASSTANRSAAAPLGNGSTASRTANGSTPREESPEGYQELPNENEDNTNPPLQSENEASLRGTSGSYQPPGASTNLFAGLEVKKGGKRRPRKTKKSKKSKRKSKTRKH